MSATRPGFRLPPYPYDRLDDLRAVAGSAEGGLVDLSVGTPCDPPPPEVSAALARSGTERGYPPSIGTVDYREAAAGWLTRRFDVSVDPDREVAACVGTKELVAGVPHWLHLRRPERDTVLYPGVSYPTYAMGAELAGLRALPYADLASVEPADAARALCLWVNSPSNPTGALADLAAAAAWGRSRDVPVLSDECYAEFTWRGRPRTILEHGTDGVLALHSLSKRSNLAGARAGFYAGDEALVGFLREVRKHAGLLVPGPVQAAGAVAWGDAHHVEIQRDRYRHRLETTREALASVGIEASMPAGGFYLWAPAPGGDAWALTRRLARDGGALVAPGELYGPAAEGFVRVAVVQPDDRIELVAKRLARSA